MMIPATALLALSTLGTPCSQESEIGGLRFEPLGIEVRTLEGRALVAQAGYLSVPENRRHADSRAITLTFAHLASTADEPGPPIVYLHGGPGGGATGDIQNPASMSIWAPFLALGEVILLDQRGCGRSLPDLQRRVPSPPPVDCFASRGSLERYLAEAGRAVREELLAEGIDYTGYDSEQSADDIVDLLDALGAEQGRLIGFSYGTHLATAVIRRHGDRIAGAVLIGTEGPDETVKLPSTYDEQFARLAEIAAADPVISEKVPDLIALYRRVIAKLAEEPMLVELSGAERDGPLRIPVGPLGLQYVLVRDFGDTNDLPVIPRLLWSIDRGDPSILTWFVRKRFGFSRYPTLAFTVDYASGCPPDRLARIEREAQSALLGNAMNAFWMPEVHAVWQMPQLGDGFRAPLQTDVRTLFLSGTLDANTPPSQAERLRAGFARSTHLVQTHGGHEDWFRNPAAQAAALDFLAGEDVAGRDVDMPPLRFLPLEGPVEGESHPSLED